VLDTDRFGEPVLDSLSKGHDLLKLLASKNKPLILKEKKAQFSKTDICNFISFLLLVANWEIFCRKSRPRSSCTRSALS
jgi:hypothetical protein